MIKDVQPKVAIFVPMSEEREILIDALSCNFQLLKHSVWQGELNGVSIHIYSPGKIGRVSAAVETMAYLNQFTPELIIVAGIAGGFKNIVNKGAVVIPEEIVDLAYRKQIESKSLYRPKIYSISSSILSYFKSNIFNEQDWSSTVILQDKFDWDKGLKPYILCEKARLVSTDEILMDQDYVDKLTNEYPDTVGVEMESGGVFAAAKQFDIDVLTIRGISDSSDAEKEDDKWRKLAMRGVSLLIKNIDYKTLLSFRRTSN
jgi:nucleoside phosphorylase